MLAWSEWEPVFHVERWLDAVTKKSVSRAVQIARIHQDSLLTSLDGSFDGCGTMM